MQKGGSRVTSRLDLDMEELCQYNYTPVTGAPETCAPCPELQFGHFYNWIVMGPLMYENL